MASEANTDKNRRKTLHLKAKLHDLKFLRKVEADFPACFKITFEGRYGKILDLISLKVHPKARTALAQLYDPPLRSFLFQDFKVTPTLEEFENILGIPLKGKRPYTSV